MLQLTPYKSPFIVLLCNKWRQKQKGRQEGRTCRQAEEEARKAKGELQHLHLQGAQAGAPRHRHLQQGDEHHELVRPVSYTHLTLPTTSRV